MSEMIDAVTAAIYEELARQAVAMPMENVTVENHTLDLRSIAVAAIAAMREPTIKMCAASHVRRDKCESIVGRWKAMIDAALDEDADLIAAGSGGMK